MKNCVSIKSFPNGLKVFLEEDASFDEILQEIHTKFSEFEKFFKNFCDFFKVQNRRLRRVFHREQACPCCLRCEGPAPWRSGGNRGHCI